MKHVLTLTAILALVAVIAAQTKQGIRPRVSVRDYAASAHTADMLIGAAQMPPKQVSHAFATDLNRGYMVVEVGVYPAVGKTPALDPQDFVLRAREGGEVVRPASPSALAAALQRPQKAGRDVTVYPSMGVGYETGPYGHGTTTAVGVGVAIGGTPQAASTPADRKVMETELTEKGLPGGTLEKAVAGYLYFPAMAKNKTYVLEYAANGMVVKINLPAQTEEKK